MIMKSVYRILLGYLLCLFVLPSCSTLELSGPTGDFVRSTHFSTLDTFSYKHTMVSGMPFRSSQKIAIQEWSKQVLLEELTTRGFEALESNADFYVVAKWRKELSSYTSLFDSIDGPSASINRREASISSPAVRFTLIVELYQTETDALFWRAELPNIFDSIQYSQERVSLSLRRAIQNFPNHIDKDPNLPDLE
jgi:hypothetical protein